MSIFSKINLSQVSHTAADCQIFLITVPRYSDGNRFALMQPEHRTKRHSQGSNLRLYRCVCQHFPCSEITSVIIMTLCPNHFPSLTGIYLLISFAKKFKLLKLFQAFEGADRHHQNSQRLCWESDGSPWVCAHFVWGTSNL